MGKYANVFCDSIYPLQIFGRYRCSNRTKKDDSEVNTDLIFSKLGGGDQIRITPTGKILFGAGEFWTLIAESTHATENQWNITFDYFGRDVSVQRFDQTINVAIGSYINPILCSSTGHSYDENE